MDIEKYKVIADKFGILDIKRISPADIEFDPRARLKCRWGCDCSQGITIRCDDKGFSLDEAKKIICSYTNIFLLHSHDAWRLTHACLEIEKAAFLAGNYFAFTMRVCNFCKECIVKKGEKCPYPEKIRPCEEIMGIDVYKTVKKTGLPIAVLQSKNDKQNRYGFVLID